MTKEEIAQAQEVIDAVQNGAPLDKPLQAAFPTSPSAAPAEEPQTKIWKCDGCGRTYYELTPLEDCECGCTSFTCIKINVLAEDAVPRTPEPDKEAAFKAAIERMGYSLDNGVVREFFNHGYACAEAVTAQLRTDIQIRTEVEQGLVNTLAERDQEIAALRKENDIFRALHEARLQILGKDAGK